MRRALIWLKLYSREADRHKLKKGRKTLKMHFLPVLELMSDSLTAIYVEPNQCPSHQSILLTQGQIHEIFTKKYRELAILKNGGFFWVGHFEFYFSKKFFFCFIPMKISHKLCIRMNGTQFFLIMMVYSQKSLPPNISAGSVASQSKN